MKTFGTPYWWDTEAPIKIPIENQFKKNKNYDLVIVGGGYTGLSAAITAKRYASNVLIIDSVFPGKGASSRNGGMIGAPHKIGFIETVNAYGEKTAKELINEGVEGYLYTKRLLETKYKNADFKETGRLRLAWTKSDFLQLKKDIDEARRLADYNVKLIDTNSLKKHIGSNVYYGGALFQDHGGLNPFKFHNEMIKDAISQKVEFLYNSRVFKIKKKHNDFEILAGENNIISKKLIITTNGYTTSNFSFIKKRILPIPSFIISTEPLREEIIKQISPGSHMMVETRSRNCYFRISPDGTRLLFGGRAALHNIPMPKAAKILKKLMLEIFPILEKVRITHCWTGNVGMTFSRMPHVGEFEGMNFALGYSGNGVALSPYLGYKVALNTLGNSNGYTSFSKTKFETKFYYNGWPWFLPIASLKFRLEDIKENFTRKGAI